VPVSVAEIREYLATLDGGAGPVDEKLREILMGGRRSIEGAIGMVNAEADLVGTWGIDVQDRGGGEAKMVRDDTGQWWIENRSGRFELDHPLWAAAFWLASTG